MRYPPYRAGICLPGKNQQLDSPAIDMSPEIGSGMIVRISPNRRQQWQNGAGLLLRTKSRWHNGAYSQDTIRNSAHYEVFS